MAVHSNQVVNNILPHLPLPVLLSISFTSFHNTLNTGNVANCKKPLNSGAQQLLIQLMQDPQCGGSPGTSSSSHCGCFNLHELRKYMEEFNQRARAACRSSHC